jgi:hypothetical protein
VPGIRALKALYPEALSVRGKIRAAQRDSVETGTIGVMVKVSSLLTAAGSAGDAVFVSPLPPEIAMKLPRNCA